MRSPKLAPLRQVTEPIAVHGEGPMWDERLGKLLWLDMLDGDILATDPQSGLTERHKGPEDVAALLRPTASGDWILVGREHIWRGDLDDWKQSATLGLAEGVRANEGGCNPGGHLFVGTMAEDEHEGGGAVYRFDGKQITVSLSETTISNGVVFDADGCWFIDSPRREIRRYTINEAGVWKAEPEAIDTSRFAGIPDGMCADTEGGLWVAFYGGAAVARFEPDGRPDIVLDIPAECPTACCFGGPDGGELFITTSRYRRSAEDDPTAGALFSAATAFRGSDVWEFDSTRK